MFIYNIKETNIAKTIYYIDSKIPWYNLIYIEEVFQNKELGR